MNVLFMLGNLHLNAITAHQRFALMWSLCAPNTQIVSAGDLSMAAEISSRYYLGAVLVFSRKKAR